MERLHNLSPVEFSTVETHVRQSYQVKSEKLDDTIYFEIEVMGSAYYLPAFPGQKIRGQIRALDANRTLVEGDLEYSPQVKFIGLLLTTLLGGGAIWLFLSGAMPAGDFLTIVGIIVVTIILIRIFGTGKGGRNLTIDRIEEQVRPLWKDLNPEYKRECLSLNVDAERPAFERKAEENETAQKPRDDA
ncbi:MAG: hypothetical protein F4X02_01870 [Chloroflexi bacterium]|nr:hypothetical protein [Chloroflexota bacterium]